MHMRETTPEVNNEEVDYLRKKIHDLTEENQQTLSLLSRLSYKYDRLANIVYDMNEDLASDDFPHSVELIRLRDCFVGMQKIITSNE